MGEDSFPPGTLPASPAWEGVGGSTRLRTRCGSGSPVPASAKSFDQLVSEASRTPFSGWDFSALDGRWRHENPPWDYSALARDRIAHASGLLDLGTGGGEVLSSMAPLPRKTFATEGYAPNLEVARRRLTPLGVQVLPIGPDNRIPLPDGVVDLVLDRHEEFDPGEVHRVLAPGGLFVAQQVGGLNNVELRERFGAEASVPTNDVSSSAALANEIARAGFVVRRQEEWIGFTEFLDVGAVVYYLKAIPWEVPGFSVSRHRAMLEEIHHGILATGSLRVTSHRLLVIAQRPA